MCAQYTITVTFCSMTGSRKVVVCNIHVLYNPNRGEIKLGQVSAVCFIGSYLFILNFLMFHYASFRVELSLV